MYKRTNHHGKQVGRSRLMVYVVFGEEPFFHFPTYMVGNVVASFPGL